MGNKDELFAFQKPSKPIKHCPATDGSQDDEPCLPLNPRFIAQPPPTGTPIPSSTSNKKLVSFKRLSPTASEASPGRDKRPKHSRSHVAFGSTTKSFATVGKPPYTPYPRIVDGSTSENEQDFESFSTARPAAEDCPSPTGYKSVPFGNVAADGDRPTKPANSKCLDIDSCKAPKASITVNPPEAIHSSDSPSSVSEASPEERMAELQAMNTYLQARIDAFRLHCAMAKRGSSRRPALVCKEDEELYP